MSLTSASASALMDYIISQAPWMGLFTAAPSFTTGGTEVSGGGYARQSVACSAAVAGETANTAAESFSIPASTTIVAAGFFTASTAGTLWKYGLIVPSVTFDSAGTYTLAIGEIQLQMG